jgi:Cof subfamily protein (haloacid dehalogenase superfamily)
MKNIYNFFIDIDGTLLSGGRKSINEETQKAFDFARSKGSKIFINTGRTKAYVPYGLRTLECIDGLCCGCGTYIEYNGKTVFEHYLSTDQLVMIADEFKKLALDKDLVFEGYERNYYLGTGGPWHEANGFIPISGSDYFKNIGFEPKVHKFSTHTQSESRDVFFKKIENEFFTMHFPTYSETVPIGYDKGRAIKITEELLGLDPDLSVAIGDSMNDAAMLQYAATSVAMGNATDEVKSMCDIVTDTVDNDGVAKIIYKLLN